MEIILNNLPEKINKSELTVAELLELKKFTFRLLVIKINGKLVKKEDRDTTFIKQGDDVSVLHLISGG